MQENISKLKNLQRQFWTIALLYVFIVPIFLFFVRHYFQAQGIEQALLVTSLVLLLQLYILWRGLDKNYGEDKQLFSNFGLANNITIFRGLLLGFLAGFICLSNYTSDLIWLAAFMYTIAILIDGIDGFLARKTQRQTPLGAILDVEFDSLAVLIGCILAVHLQKLPVWYIVIGLSRYAFIVGVWVATYFGREIQSLPPSLYRRTLATSHMYFIFISLYPSSSIEILELIAIVLVVPFCIAFFKDWLIVISFLKINAFYKKFCNFYFYILPLLLRISLIFILFYYFEIYLLVAFICIILGFYGRIAAIALATFEVLFTLSIANFAYSSMIICLALISLNGLGKYVLWSPEEKWNWGMRVI